MNITIEEVELRDLERAASLEWIETNGIGGYASSTVVGLNTRGYHGVLVAAIEAPARRAVMLSRLDETIITPNGRIELATRRYPGCVNPEGYLLLRSFRRGIFPSWIYAGAEFHLEKNVAALHGENTVIITYKLVTGAGGVKLGLRPFVAARDYHARRNKADSFDPAFEFESGRLTVRPAVELPAMVIAAPGASFNAALDWYYQFEYQAERDRGFAANEDLASYGELEAELKPGDELHVIVTTEDREDFDGRKLLEQEMKRRAQLLEALSIRDGFAESLVLAADQFIVKRGPSRKTVIAGYHWFTDWGRDTMIALPGLTLSTGRIEDARLILEEFSEHLNQGLIPNRFPDKQGPAEYNTVDATLWYFVALYRYYCASDDLEFIKKPILPLLLEAIAAHERGTRYSIHVDKDGLLSAGEAGVQLTWMDAKVGDRVVTPRTGKAVEINALWYNTLKIAAEFCELCSKDELSQEFGRKAAAVKRSFAKSFWNADLGCLYDCIHDGAADPSIRPNQIIALSLPFEILTKEKAQAVLHVVKRELLTPLGLRTLNASDPNYRGRYCGDPASRDTAYHQGTVWPWLIGPYITALIRYGGKAEAKEAREILAG
ncbi:MAG: glycogen debranching protein, partial [Proteobacteria bacterium]